MAKWTKITLNFGSEMVWGTSQINNNNNNKAEGLSSIWSKIQDNFL